MVIVNVNLSTGDADGVGYRTIAYYNVDGTNTTTSTGFNNLNYTDYQIYMNESFSRVPVPNPTTPTAYSEFRFSQRAYFIFTGITIPQNSIIDNATLSFTVSTANANYQTLTATVLGRKTASPVPYTTYNSATPLFTKPVATAQGTFTVSSYPTNSELTPKTSDVKAIVQELVNAFDYSNDSMMFMLQQPSLRNAVPPPTTSPSVFADNEFYFMAQEEGVPFTNLTINFTPSGQNCFPVLDISNAGAWEDITFGNNDGELWNELDDPLSENDGESSAVRSVVPPLISDTFEVKLQNDCFDPFSSTAHIIRWTARGVGNQAKVQLFQGVTLIAESPTVALTEFFVDRTYVLSDGEANSITDYSDLRIRVVPSVVP